MEKTHAEFLKMAIQIATENINGGGGPFGAVIVKNNEVIATSGNSVSLDNDPTAHAEVNAIRKAAKKLGSFELTGCTIYSSCEPCPMCLGAIYWARIETLYFAATRDDAHRAGFSDAFIYNEINIPLSQRSVHTIHLPTDNALLPFITWDENESKTLY
ncbi:MAG TPA: nucleoside deaminase [Bacteroidales bacterium]|nr:nucleoside deaminase [Bacteroidales bacterium]